MLRAALTDVARITVGFEKQRHSYWFRESINDFEQLFQKRNQLYLRWLGSCLSSNKEKFSKARSEARKQ